MNEPVTEPQRPDRWSPRSTSAAPRLAPRWVPELLEILDERRIQVMRTAVGLVVAAALLSLLSPDTLRPSLGVGLLVGIAATALAAAIAFALDAADPVVRGERHVRGADTNVLGTGRDVAATADALAAALDELLGAPEATGALHLGIVGTGTDAAEALAHDLGRALAALDNRVLAADLRRPTDEPGVGEVVLGTVPLPEAVRFEADVTVAEIAAGRDLGQALRTYPTFLANLPRDIDLTLAQLPSPTSDDLHEVAAPLHHVLVVAERDGTRRLDLTQVLDGLETTGVQAHVVLVEPARRTSRTLEVPPTTPRVTDLDPDPVDHEPPTIDDEPLPVEPAPDVAAAPAEPAAPTLAADTPEVAFDELDPDLLAQALLTGDLEVDDDEVQDEVGDDEAGGDEVATVDLTDPAPTDPDPTVPTPRVDAPVAPTVPTVPTAPASPITRGGLGTHFAQQPGPGEDPLSAPSMPGAPPPSMPPPSPASPPPPPSAPEVDDEARHEAIGGADSADDDPLGMTAALYTFASERLQRDEESDR